MAQNQITGAGRLIVIGGSSGSIDALLAMLPVLKKDFVIPILLVIHRSIAPDNALTELLAVNTSLSVKEADEKEMLMPGWIYIAPPDYHVLPEADMSLSLDASEKINYSRPSIDVSFIAAAVAYGKNCIAVLLSGANADGADGMKAVKAAGGKAIVQQPAEAMVPYMPVQAIARVSVDHVLPAAGIAAFLNSL